MLQRIGMLISLFLLSSVLLTGCWNREELSELAIAVGMGIDKDDKGQYVITYQVVNPSEVAASNQSSTGRSTTVAFTGKGKTVFEALRRITKVSPRRIYLAHLRVVLIGEQLARQGIKDSIDFLARNHEVRNDFYLAVAKNSKAADLLKIFTPLEKTSAQKIFNSIATSEKTYAPTMSIFLDELISDLLSKTKSPVLTGIQMTGDKEEGENKKNVEKMESPTLLQISNLAIFKKDKLVGWFNENESKGYNYIKDNVQNTVGTLPCPKGGNFVVEVINNTTEFKAKMKKGKPIIQIHVFTEGNIGEVQCDVDISDVKVISQLEKEASKRIKGLQVVAIKKAQKLKSDVFGFGEAIHRKYPKLWKTLEKRWDDEFPKLETEIIVECKIRRTGTLSKSIVQETK